VVERYGYDAYGTVRFMDANFGSRSSSSYAWETLYGSYRWDSETGLYQVRNRYLHSKLGRWLTRDPLGEAVGLNLYGFLSNNPSNGVDPLGLIECKRPRPTRDCAGELAGCSALAAIIGTTVAGLIFTFCDRTCRWYDVPCHTKCALDAIAAGALAWIAAELVCLVLYAQCLNSNQALA